MFSLIKTLRKNNKLPLCIMNIILTHVHELQMNEEKNDLLERYGSWDNIFLHYGENLSGNFFRFFNHEYGLYCEKRYLFSKYEKYWPYQWATILKYEKVSEEFIEFFINNFSHFHWDIISEYRILSDSFIEKHKNKLFLHKLKNKKIIMVNRRSFKT